MNKFLKRGFTLIEILISIFFILLIFILLHRTFFTIRKNITAIEEEIKNKKILCNFLNSFRVEIEGIFDIENSYFSSKEIQFITYLPDKNFPFEINYSVEKEGEEEKLIRVQKNVLTDYQYTLPILKCENINFLFLFDDKWTDEVEKDRLPKGIAIEIIYPEKRIFYPVILNIERKDEKE